MLRLRIKDVRDQLLLSRIKSVSGDDSISSLRSIYDDESLKDNILAVPNINTEIKGHRDTLTFEIWNAGDRNSPVFSETITTNIFGEAMLTIPNIDPGIFDVTIQRPYALRKALNNVNIQFANMTFDFTKGADGGLKFGDFNQDNVVNLADFFTIRDKLIEKQDSALIEQIDLNEDGEINLADFAQILQNWGSGE